MNGLETVREALSPFSKFTVLDGEVAVPTQCLYPSNSTVTVYVRGGARDAIVSDDGAAIDELTSHNRLVDEPDRYLRRFCRPVGLKWQRGKIFSESVPSEQLTSAILLVANASSTAARWGFDHIKFHRRRNRDLRQELQGVLLLKFQKGRIETGRRLTGKSSRSYRFDQVVRFDHERFLVIDAVVPDANSINSHAIAHMDLKGLDDKSLIQRIVYDDEEDWRASDLNLLQMATTIVPFSKVNRALERIETSIEA